MVQNLCFIPNLKKSDLIPAQKFTFIGMEFLTQQNLVRVPADLVDSLILNIKTVLSQTQVLAQTFFSLLGKLSAAADFILLGRLHLQPLQVCLLSVETTHISSRSSGYDQQYDQISFEMVDEHQLFGSRRVHSSTRSQYFPSYGCQSLWMRSSSRTDESILSWLLVGRPIPAPYQYVRNNGNLFRTEESLKIYSHNSGLLYQQARRNTFSQPLCTGVEDFHLVPGETYNHQDSSYTRQIQCFGRLSIENGQTYQNRMGVGSVDC